MENGDEDGYVTEKIMNVYRGGAIPIYWGTNDVKNIFNSESFINVKDYSSYEECAKDIIAIRDDKERYEKMRNTPIFVKDSHFSSYWDEESPSWVKDIANSSFVAFGLGGVCHAVIGVANLRDRKQYLSRSRIWITDDWVHGSP